MGAEEPGASAGGQPHRATPAAPAGPVIPVDSQAELGRVAAEFTVFYRDYLPRLVRFLAIDGAPVTLAAELAQEAMLELWRAWDTVQSPRAWTRTVASRAWIRYRIQLPELPADLPEPGPVVSAEDATAVEVRHDLLRLLRLLTPRERQIMARTYDGDTPAEIAAELQIAEATVRSTQRNARRKMSAHRHGRQEGADR
jgi:RNA polymerase sigma factor (sigma-70 family)